MASVGRTTGGLSTLLITQHQSTNVELNINGRAWLRSARQGRRLPGCSGSSASATNAGAWWSRRICPSRAGPRSSSTRPRPPRSSTRWCTTRRYRSPPATPSGWRPRSRTRRRQPARRELVDATWVVVPPLRTAQLRTGLDGGVPAVHDVSTDPGFRDRDRRLRYSLRQRRRRGRRMRRLGVMY